MAQGHEEIPRFLWRVETSRSRHSIRQYQETVEYKIYRDWISAHMMWENYSSPCLISSLTGSLLWALNFAHWLLTQRRGDIKIFLVDAWQVESRFRAAKAYAISLNVAPRGKPWHDDPFHEYFAFGGLPSRAILGCFSFDAANLTDINLLLPGFDHLNPEERLYDSFGRFNMLVTRGSGELGANAAILHASILTKQYLPDLDRDVHFQIAMMFASLELREWHTVSYDTLFKFFYDGPHLPAPDEYLPRNYNANGQMLDVEEWTRGMERFRTCMTVSERETLQQMRSRHSAGAEEVATQPGSNFFIHSSRINEG